MPPYHPTLVPTHRFRLTHADIARRLSIVDITPTEGLDPIAGQELVFVNQCCGWGLLVDNGQPVKPLSDNAILLDKRRVNRRWELIFYDPQHGS